MKIKKSLLLLLFVSISKIIEAQPTVAQFVEKTNTLNKSTLQEKIYVHLDRSFYITGETAWFKIYLVDGYIHTPINTSTVVYLEILDRDHTPISQSKIEIKDGLGNGSLLIPTSLGSDQYIVRAYTNWMKNFSSDFYYHQTISIVNPFRTLQKTKSLTSPNLDIQFFPEGGQLVDGVSGKVACRVVNESGIGIEYHGFILSSRNDTLVHFKPLVSGIGHFNFTPDINEQYQVVIQTDKKYSATAKLPDIESAGFTLQVVDTTENRLSIKIKSKGRGEVSHLYFIAHTRQIVKISSAHDLRNGNVEFFISKNDLGEGISHLTIFNSNFKPLCDRLVFNFPKKDSQINIKTDQLIYSTRSKIKLTVSKQSLPSSYLSLSVFKNDSLEHETNDIINSLLLTSDLKGNIENPDYYFSKDPLASKAIDNLMLTHGWSRFKWTDIEKLSKPIEFLPELRGHLVMGTIKQQSTGSPVQGISINLSYPSKAVQFYGSYSNSGGEFLFELKNFYGKKKIILNTSLPDSVVRFEIRQPFSKQFSTYHFPYLDLSTGFIGSLTARSVSMQVNDTFKQKEKSKSTTRSDSTAFYGKASEQYTLDDYTRFPVMEEVIREYVKGVRLRKKNNEFYFRVNNVPKTSVFDNDPLVLLDGVPVSVSDQIITMDPLKIKQIDVMTCKYFLGPLSFDGIVSFKTFAGDLGGLQLSKKTFILDYEGLQSQKEFFSPLYETAKELESRLPDARYLLFWEPDITLSEYEKQFEFFTSDQPGVFKAVLQGVTQDGQPIHEQCSLTVVKSK